MYKGIFGGAALSALIAGMAAAAQSQPPSQVWVITPGEDSCHTDIDLMGRSGATAQVSLVSDGANLELRFAKGELPQRAFLPIRVDQKPYANLMVQRESPKQGAMTLSPETVEAIRKGKTLQIAWLIDEPVSARLGGSEQGVTDLVTCGAQVAAQYKAAQAAQQAAQVHAEAEARAKAVEAQQIAAARAQQEAAEATRAREAAETDRIRAATAALEAQRQAADAAARQRAEAVQRAEDDGYGYGYPYRRREAPRPWAQGPRRYEQPYYPPDEAN